MLSKKTKYALKSLIYLANNQEAGAVLISELAEKERMPRKFLELILLTMKNKGVLMSKKGRGGGYQLARSPKAISIGEVVRMFDGPLAPVQCVSETAYAKCSECADERTCGIRLVMKDARDALADILDGTTLADVLLRVESAAALEGPQTMYYI